MVGATGCASGVALHCRPGAANRKNRSRAHGRSREHETQETSFVQLFVECMHMANALRSESGQSVLCHNIGSISLYHDSDSKLVLCVMCALSSNSLIECSYSISFYNL